MSDELTDVAESVDRVVSEGFASKDDGVPVAWVLIVETIPNDYEKRGFWILPCDTGKAAIFGHSRTVAGR